MKGASDIAQGATALNGNDPTRGIGQALRPAACLRGLGPAQRARFQGLPAVAPSASCPHNSIPKAKQRTGIHAASTPAPACCIYGAHVVASPRLPRFLRTLPGSDCVYRVIAKRRARGAFFVLPHARSVPRWYRAEGSEMPRTPSAITRDSVFVAGGQPSITYVDRAHLKIEDNLAQALKVPNQIVSVAGPTKSGKTVLCRAILSKAQHVWIEGGQIETAAQIWDKTCYVLNYPVEIAKAAKDEGKAGVKVGLLDWLSFEGSLLKGSETKRTYTIDSMASAIRHLKEEGVTLVIDDFHYLPSNVRTTFLRNIKGPVFDGLKLVLLSVTHRGLDAIKAESELQGRVYSVIMPEWEKGDLKQIAEKGFAALNIDCPPGIISRLADEAQGSPFLMQKLCWEICAGIGVDTPPPTRVSISDSYDFVPICQRLSKDFGHPIYQKLEVGPQSRKARRKRTLASGGYADIYKLILMAIAATGPKSTIPYDELREGMNRLLREDMPQKREITSALKHLSAISQKIGNDAGLDWDGEERKIDISDPYLRFFLRWQIRPLTVLHPRRMWVWDVAGRASSIRVERHGRRLVAREGDD
jgi:hypothetical protein